MDAVRISTVMMRTLGACIVGGCGKFSYIPTSGLCRTLDRPGVLGVTVGLRVPPRK
jgi:hypothetical protein